MRPAWRRQQILREAVNPGDRRLSRHTVRSIVVKPGCEAETTDA
jgi:hypothetical protein